MLIIYDLRKNIPANQLGKNGAFWNWLGNFANSLLEHSSDILNSIFGGGTKDNITYVTQVKSSDEYDQIRKQNQGGGSSSTSNNMLLYAGIGAAVILGSVFILTRDKKKR